jgi:acetylglutamate/LysW-gamma-L-alpha-aminoadipate kinase
MLLIKIGGGLDMNLSGIIGDLSEIDEKFIIVHGANAVRDQLAQKLGTPKKVLTSISGYSSVYSDETMIDNIMMAYAGLKNKRIVELCQQNGINAVGLTGLDGAVVRGKRNAGIRIQEGSKRKIVRDFSGKPQEINKSFLKLLVDNGYAPVMTIPIIDENNFAINSENDDIVNVIQRSFAIDKVLQLIAAPGFLDDVNDPGSVVDKISQDELTAREERVQGRMKRKILAIRKLLEGGAQEVIISDGRTEHPVRDALEGKGTVIA